MAKQRRDRYDISGVEFWSPYEFRDLKDPLAFLWEVSRELDVSIKILARLRRAVELARGKEKDDLFALNPLAQTACTDVYEAMHTAKHLSETLSKDELGRHLAEWTNEALRLSKSFSSAFVSRRLSQSVRARVVEMLADGQRRGVKKMATEKLIATNGLGYRGKDYSRHVKRIVNEHKKSRGGVRQIDRSLLHRDLESIDVAEVQSLKAPKRRGKVRHKYHGLAGVRRRRQHRRHRRPVTAKKSVPTPRASLTLVEREKAFLKEQSKKAKGERSSKT